MSTLRERRLQSDHEALLDYIEAAGGRMLVESQSGSPADTYGLLFRCRSVVELHDGVAAFGLAHRVKVYLPAQYPAAAPVASMRSPLVHPHVWANGVICLGGWSPVQKLDSVLARIASILTFDPAGMNWRSVADESAVPWTREHWGSLPLDAAFPAGVESGSEMSLARV